MNTFVLVTSRETRPITRTPGQLGEHLYDLGPVEGRKAVDAVQSGEGVERPDVGITDLTVPGDPSGEISLRILEPAGRTAGLAEVLAVSQRPLAAAAFGEPAAAAAWEVKPSRRRVLLGDDDQSGRRAVRLPARRDHDGRDRLLAPGHALAPRGGRGPDPEGRRRRGRAELNRIADVGALVNRGCATTSTPTQPVRW
jgi:hypothetical protein